MSRIVAAIKTGTDPLVPLPPASFHRTLEEPVYCPKCDAAYMLVADYDWAVSRYFADESRRHLAMLRRAITNAHTAGHPATHLECNGVIVESHHPTPPVDMTPLTRLLQ